MAERLTEIWKQQVLVDNKGGGGGIPGTEAGKAAPPDGYTLLVATSGTFGVNPSLYPDLPYRPLVDFKPITNILRGPLVIVAHPSFPASTVGELIELAAKEPGKLSYASAGPGTAQHLSMELFKLQAKIDIVHVPYKGSGPAMADLLGGHVKLMMDSTASALSAIRDGRIKALGVTTARRLPAPLDKVPSIGETVRGLRFGRLVRVGGAGQDPGRDREQGECRSHGRAARSGDAAAVRGAGDAGGTDDTRRVLRLHRQGHGDLGRGGEGHRDQAGQLEQDAFKSNRPHPEERPKAASRRVGTTSMVPTLRDASLRDAPQGEACVFKPA